MNNYVATRVRYFGGEPLLTPDFRAEQKYHKYSREIFNRGVFRPGILEGFKIQWEADAVAPQVIVMSGTALDGLGRSIMLANERTIDLTGVENGKQYFLTVRYQENLAGQDPNLPAMAETGPVPGLVQLKRIVEEPLFGWSETYAPNETDVLLAVVELADGKISAVKSESGGFARRRRIGAALGAVLFESESSAIVSPPSPDQVPLSIAARDNAVTGRRSLEISAPQIALDGDVVAGDLNTTDLNVVGNVTVTGDATIGGTLGTAGNATIGGTLGTAGDATIGRALGTAGDARIGGALGTAGDATIGGALGTAGDATIGGALGTAGDATIGGALGTAGDATIGGTLGTAGDATIGGALNTAGNVTIDGTFESKGKATVGGDLDVSGNISGTLTGPLQGGAEVKGALTVDAALAVAAGVTVGGGLSVAGSLSVTGSITGTLGGTTVDGDLLVKENLEVDGNLTVKGTLGPVTRGEMLTVDGDVDVAGDFIVEGEIKSNVAGLLAVDCELDLKKDVTVEGQLASLNGINVSGAVKCFGSPISYVTTNTSGAATIIDATTAATDGILIVMLDRIQGTDDVTAVVDINVTPSPSGDQINSQASVLWVNGSARPSIVANVPVPKDSQFSASLSTEWYNNDLNSPFRSVKVHVYWIPFGDVVQTFNWGS